jgi:hypothetical protein
MTTLFNNLQPTPPGSWDFGENYPRHAQQFRLLLPATITELTFMLAKYGSTVTGTIVAKIYGSDGAFRDSKSIPTGAALATSTTTVDVSTLEDRYDGGRFQEVDFAFNSVELPAGTYWASIECDDIDTNDGDSSLIIGTDDSSWYVYGGNNLGSFSEYRIEESEYWASAWDMD